MDSVIDQSGSVQLEKLKVDEIAERMNCSNRTVYSHIEKEGWEKVEGAWGRVWYMVPTSYIEAYVQDRAEIKGVAPQPPEPVTEPATPTSQNTNATSDLVIEAIRTAHEAALQAKDETIATLQARVKDMENDKSILNRELENRNTALVSLRNTVKNPLAKFFGSLFG